MLNPPLTHSICARHINVCHQGTKKEKKYTKNKYHIPVQINLVLIFVDLVTLQIELMTDYCGSLGVVLYVGG